MKGAPPTRHAVIDQMQVVIKAVDQRGREMDQRWGIGRLPLLVPIAWAERFHHQHRLFNAAVWAFEPEEVRQHGDAMLRAYDRLDALAREAGALPLLPAQWEFEIPDGLVVLVQDIRDVGRVELHGRKAQIWSLDEIANVIRAHPMLAAAKDIFPGAEVISIRPPKATLDQLDDELMDVPF